MKPESVSRFDSMSEEEPDASTVASGYASADELRAALMNETDDVDPTENYAAMDLAWDDR